MSPSGYSHASTAALAVAFFSTLGAPSLSEMLFFSCYIPSLMGDTAIPIPHGDHPLKLSVVMH